MRHVPSTGNVVKYTNNQQGLRQLSQVRNCHTSPTLTSLGAHAKRRESFLWFYRSRTTPIYLDNISKSQFRNTLIYIILSGETFQRQICQPCKTSPSRNSTSRSRHYRASMDTSLESTICSLVNQGPARTTLHRQYLLPSAVCSYIRSTKQPSQHSTEQQYCNRLHDSNSVHTRTSKIRICNFKDHIGYFSVRRVLYIDSVTLYTTSTVLSTTSWWTTPATLVCLSVKAELIFWNT
jgi:hypothetical protein